jgi:hypothetical protein
MEVRYKQAASERMERKRLLSLYSLLSLVGGGRHQF